MKAILVIDINEDTDINTLRANFEVYGDIRIKPCYQSSYQIGEGVKLKPMPSKRKSMVEWIDAKVKTHDLTEYDKGWNDCVEFLEGEK